MDSTENRMETVNAIDPSLPKIYRVKGIYGASILGGPLAAGYLIAHNYKIFGETENVKKTWIISILCTIAIFIIVFSLPASTKFPSKLIPLIYTGIAYALMTYYQGKRIDAHLGNGAAWFNGWRIFAVALITLAITMACVFGYLLIADPTLTASTKSYGATENIIMYHSSNATSLEVDKVAEALEQMGWFNNQKSISVYFEKEKSSYEITFALIDQAWKDPETVKAFLEAQAQLQKIFPANHIIIKLSSVDDFPEVEKTLN